MRYVIRTEADRDLDEIAGYLLEHAGLEMSLRFFTQTDKTFSLLANQPGMGWQCKLELPDLKRVRVVPVGSPSEKYLVFYQRTVKRIEIIRVLHGFQSMKERFLS